MRCESYGSLLVCDANKRAPACDTHAFIVPMGVTIMSGVL